MDRMRRFFLTCGILAVITVMVLGIWEVYRQSQFFGGSLQGLLAAEPRPNGETSQSLDPKAIDLNCRDDRRFQAILEQARAKIRAANARSQQLAHTETQIARELDEDGKAVTSERHVENVWTENGVERRQTIERVEPNTGKVPPNIDYSIRESPTVKERFPLTDSNAEDGYTYRFGGVEQVGNRWSVRIDFAPKNNPKGRFRGQIWIDPTSNEPMRFFGVLADKRLFLDQFSMLIDYGIAENGEIQVVRSVLDGCGGFAMIQKHFQSEVHLHHYRALAERSAYPSSHSQPTP